VAFPGLAVVQRQVVAASASGENLPSSPGTPPGAESTECPTGADQTGADGETQRIQHSRSVRRRIDSMTVVATTGVRCCARR